MICDFAETYHVLDYRGLPLTIAGALCFGLRADSRIKMKMANIKIDLKETLLCMIYDACSLNVWMQSKDGVDGVNKPESILQTFMPELKRKTNVMSFDNPEDFLLKFKEIAEG